jgi:AraC family transcriptional regulator of adaptative response / DNA-3-methyladenine glycosylase II
MVRLTLEHRLPLAWDALVATLRADATPGAELIEGHRYARTAGLGGHFGLVVVEHATDMTHVKINVSVSLLPVLMPLLARLRQLLDLDAEPAVIDTHLAGAGLTKLVALRRGLRVPGVFDGFEFAVRALIEGGGGSRQSAAELAGRLTQALGQPIETGITALNRLGVTAEQVASAGAAALAALGVPRAESAAMAAMARAVAERKVQLEPGAEVPATLLGLTDGCGVSERTAQAIVMRALHWPDAFPAAEPSLPRAAGVANQRALLRLAERWRPWRAYAAMHLRLHLED